MEKGTRPEPSDCLPADFICSHLKRFEEGASKFMLSDNLAAFGIGQRDGTTFVFPSSELETLMTNVDGDRTMLEKSLRLPDGYFSAYAVVRVDIPEPGGYGLRLPSGNEAGANDQWLPGGFLPRGMPEAVIDGAEVPTNEYVVTDMFKKEGNEV